MEQHQPQASVELRKNSYQLSIRACDGGWHHQTLNAAELAERIAFHQAWCRIIRYVPARSHAGPPFNALALILLTEEGPLCSDHLSALRGLRHGDVLVTSGAYARLAEGGLPGLLSRQLQPCTEFFVLADFESPGVLSLRPELISPGIEESVRVLSNASKCDWSAFKECLGTSWRKMLRTLPINESEDLKLAIPGLLAFGFTGIGELSAANLLEGGGVWRLPQVDSAKSTDWLAFSALRERLDQSSAGRQALDACLQFKVSCYDGLCLLERHLPDNVRAVVGSSIDEIAFNASQCMSLAPYLRSTGFAQLALSARAANFANANQLHVYGDLAPFAFGLRLGMVNRSKCDRGELDRDVVRGLRRYADRFEVARVHSCATGDMPAIALPPGATLLAALKAELDLLPEPQKDVLRFRLGFECEVESLDAIARRRGVTRERVRQIEAAGLRALSRTHEIFDTVCEAVLDRLGEQGAPLTRDQLAQSGPTLGWIRHDPTLFSKLCSAWAPDLVQVVLHESGSVFVLSGMRRVIESAKLAVRDVRRKSMRLGVSLTSVLHAMPSFRALSQDAQRGFELAIADPSGPYGQLVECKPPLLSDLIARVVRDSDRPVNVDIAVAQVGERFGRVICASRAHALLIELALPFGNRTYGLDHHLPLGVEEAKRVADAIDQSVDSLANHEWRVRALQRLAIGGDVGALVRRLTKFELSAVIRLHSKRLKYARRLTFTKRFERRTYGKDVAEAALVKLGRAASASEIHSCVASTLPGIRYQVRPSKRLARLVPGVWGLRGRDFEIEEQLLQTILEWIIERLRVHQSLPHTEIVGCADFAIANARSPTLATITIADLAHASRRMRLSATGGIRLAKSI